MLKKFFSNNFAEIFKITLPVLLGYIPLGIGFGLLSSQNNYSVFIAFLMSVFMYAGSGQYMAIALFASGASISTILITEILLNIRHIVYGFSLIDDFKECKFKPYLIFALTDETYSILTTSKIPSNVSKTRFYFTVSFLDQVYWILGSLIGAILGTILKRNAGFDFGGIDFALTALFAVLFIEQIKSTKDYFAPIVGVLSSIFSVILWKFSILKSSNNILLISLALSLSIILIFKKNSVRPNGVKVENRN